MDDLVKAAMTKWPNVPDCRGWLALDARGDWYMRDDACQRAGAFPHPKGSRITHDKLRDFIARNYQPDAHGAWHFQNGPQRVFVALEAAPLVLIDVAEADALAHTGERLPLEAFWLDEAGWLYASTPRGLALVHSQAMDAAADWVAAGAWQPREVQRAELPARFGFQLNP